MSKLDLDKAVYTRASEAYNPHTGERVGNDVLRRNPARLRVPKFVPTKVYRNFTSGITRMSYAQLVTRMGTFEAAVPGATKLVLGQSSQGRDIVAYRIGPADKDALLFVTGVHGNEVDGTEGMFQFLADLEAGTHPEFAGILAQWSIWWVVAANPDGWNSNLRNLASVGPNGQTENLNRQFPYFWADYVESSAESKGTAPAGQVGASVESTALYNFMIDPARRIKGFVDHHQNVGQGHRYLSENRVYSWQGGRAFNKDWDVLRLQGAIRKMRGTQEDGLFCQFRRSKNVPHLHSWASGALGIVSLALESRKDEPRAGVEGVKPNCEWVYDTSLAFCIAMTDAYWALEDTVQIERAATNLVTLLEWESWNSTEGRPVNFSRSRFTGARVQGQELFPHNSHACQKVTPKLDATPTEASPDWAAVSLGDVVVALGRYPSYLGGAAPGFQTMLLSGATVDTAPGVPFGHLAGHGGTRGFGMVYIAANEARMYGGWDEDGNGLSDTGFGVSGASGLRITGIPAYPLPHGLADMGYASDGARYSVFVGGSIETVASPFVGDLSDKILLFDADEADPALAWTDTGLVLPSARKRPTVVHQAGTDKFWIFGGELNDGTLYDTVHVYDRAAGTLTAGSGTLPAARSRMCGSAWGTTIYLYGGVTDLDPAEVRATDVLQFNPSTQAFTTPTILANLEDEASHDETPWARELTLCAAGCRTASGDPGEIFIIGGYTNPAGSSAVQGSIYAHRPSSNVLTFARNGLYSLFSRTQDIAVTPGDWVSISSWSKALAEGSSAYHRATLTAKSSGGTWLRHGRSYYRVPFVGRWFWERTATPIKAGEANVRPYLRTYVHNEPILYDRWMVAKRSRASSFIDGTRADGTLIFSEKIALNNFRIRFWWNPTFGFVNVGENLELCRVQADANNYIALVLIQGTGKTYHSGNSLVGAQYPQVELRKVVGGSTVATLSLTLYYGYDCRSSNQENYEDPVEIELGNVQGRRFEFGIRRYGTYARTELRTAAATVAFAAAAAAGQLRYNGEGEYGIPSTVPVTSKKRARVSAARRDLAAAPGIIADCIHPGEPIAA